MSHLRFRQTHIVYLCFKHCKTSAGKNATVQHYHNINMGPKEISQRIFEIYS